MKNLVSLFVFVCLCSACSKTSPHVGTWLLYHEQEGPDTSAIDGSVSMPPIAPPDTLILNEDHTYKISASYYDGSKGYHLNKIVINGQYQITGQNLCLVPNENSSDSITFNFQINGNDTLLLKGQNSSLQKFIKLN